MNQSTVTNTHRTIEARQFGNRVRIVVFGAMWSDVSLEWIHPKLAQRRFDKLVEMNSKKPVKSRQVGF
jgi:hypothetical protein